MGTSLSPEPEHLSQAGVALERIAEEFSGGDGTPLVVRLCSFRLDPLLSPNLFGFHVYEFSEEGIPIDSLEPDHALNYAVVANHTVELQQEIVALFLLQLVYRQHRQREMKEEGLPTAQIDIEMARQDQKALRDLRDTLNPLSFSLSALAEQVHGRARDADLRLEVMYEADVFPQREQIVRRIPWLRRIYNETDPVRSAVDKVVSMIGGEEPSIRASGGASSVRDFMQQWGGSMDLRYYINQATRDAEVCGNGFAAFQKREPIGLYNLRPERVQIRPDGSLSDEESGTVFSPEEVIHVKGIDQVRSPYGISMLEAFMPSIVLADKWAQIRTQAQSVVDQHSTPEELRERVAGYIALANRASEGLRDTISDLLWFPERHLPDPTSRLYFPGHEDLVE